MGYYFLTKFLIADLSYNTFYGIRLVYVLFYDLNCDLDSLVYVLGRA